MDAPLDPPALDPQTADAIGQALLCTGPLPVLLYDVETLAVLWCNEAAARTYGYTPAEFTRLTLRDLRLPEEVPAQLGRMPRLPDGMVAGGPFPHRTRHGTLLEVEVHVRDVPLPGRARRIVVLDDVTARMRAERRERFLSHVSRVLAGSLDVETTLASIAQLAIDHLADGCAVHLRAQGDDGGGDALVLLTVASRDPAKAELLRELERRFPASATRSTGAVAALRDRRATLYRTRVDAERAGDDEMLALWDRLGLSSCIFVPLVTPAGVLGVVSLASVTRGRHFEDADLTMAEELARHAALALENAQLYAAERRARQTAEQLARRNGRLQALTAALAGTLTHNEVADVVLTQGMHAFGAKAASVALVSEDGQALELVHAVGYPPDVVDGFRRLPLEFAFPLTDAVRRGEPIWLPTVAERDRHYPHLAGLRRTNGGGAMAAVPLALEGRVLGAMGFNFHQDVPLDADDRAFILTLARQCAQALERARLYGAERRARAAMEAARLEAEAANRTKTQFLAVMSHELRTPLNAIAGYVELLEMGIRGPLTPEQREDLARVRRNQRQLLGLINDVLNFAKLETGAVRYDIGDVPVRELLDAVEPSIAPQMRQRELRYDVVLRRVDLVLRADPDKLQQILLNLLSNAVKFTAPGGAVCVTAEERGAQVQLQVRDTGCGIPADRLESVFEPFVQLDQRLTRTSEGTGLGLAISRDLARAMGGDLTVESEPDVGSVFTVSLPRGGA
ncbi:MAG TPA: ATP-binding protein [Gemmatimonadaceae bacterium]|nr:ATP-binding protein [Gemmatimonadaceae bacterium]